MTRVTSPLLNDIERIYLSAGEHDDGSKCCVAPSPALQDRITAELERLRAAASPLVARGLRVQEPARLGFNDGLNVPGDALPAGMSPAQARGLAASRAPLRGELRVAVVLVDFSDKPFAQTAAHFEDLFFSTGKLPNGSVREYYQEVTNGLITISGAVVGPFRLPQTLAAYAHGASGTGSASPNAQTMAHDAAVLADAAIDFTPYDNDGNGYVDAFIVVHAGGGGEETGATGDIWSHKWTLDGGELVVDGTKIFAYLTVPEDAKIGVCAHELGHLLFGFPDLYDIDYSTSGVGNWCLMGGGSWNGGGDIPAHFSAWCKSQQGWVTTVNQTQNATIQIADVRTSHQIYRLWTNGTVGQEYFLVENRQLGGYDARLPGAGLLIWHIDDGVAGNANDAHPQVKLLQADGLDQLKTGANRGDAGDPYPGTTANHIFDATSKPNAHSYSGSNTLVSVTDIGASAATIGAKVTVRAVPLVKPPQLADAVGDGVLDHLKARVHDLEQKLHDALHGKG